MSQLGVEGLRAERDATLTVAKSLTDDEWNAPSDCARVGPSATSSRTWPASCTASPTRR